MRVDLFTVIHKGIRQMLFDLAGDAARCDVRSSAEVDLLVARVERAIGFLDEHARHEDLQVLPRLRAIAPDLAATMSSEHRALDIAAATVEKVAHELAAAGPEERAAEGARLAQALNQLLALQLVHMGREETEVNPALWAALDDVALVEIRTRIVGAIPAVRYDEWRVLMAAALNPVERALVIG